MGGLTVYRKTVCLHVTMDGMCPVEFQMKCMEPRSILNITSGKNAGYSRVM